MTTALTALVAIAMVATLGVVIAGVLGMSGGEGGSRRSNILMRWRIGLQFTAIALAALLTLLLGK